MFQVTIENKDSALTGVITHSFINLDRALRCFNANKGDGVNVILTAPNGDLIEGSKGM